MEATDKITKGTILVCIKTQSTSCGIKYCKQGSIVKCAKEPKDHHESIAVFRNRREENSEVAKWVPVDRKKLRLATEEESHLYHQDKYFLEEITSK